MRQWPALSLLREFNPYHDERGRFASGTRVGITSYRKPDQQGIDKTDEATYTRLVEFRGRLTALPGVSQVSVARARGRWKGGNEPSWSVSYVGNGAARRLMAEYGKRHGPQDAVLMIYGDRAGKDVLTEFRGTIPERAKRFVDKALALSGCPGWTWYRNRTGDVLRAATVASWGGDPARHREIMGMVAKAFRRLDVTATRRDRPIRTETMGAGNDVEYDAVLRGGQ